MQPIYTCRQFIISTLTALLLVLLLAACGDIFGTGQPASSDPTRDPTTVPTPTPEPLGGNLTIRLAADVPQLRPWQPRNRSEEQVVDLLYSGLTRLDDQLRPQPDLASGWDITPDGRVLTFTLRSDVSWHDGQPLDAEDVLFTLEQLRALPYTSTALLADLRYIAAVSVPASNTVVLSLTERYAPLLAELTLPILPQHLLQDRNVQTLNFWDVPIGSGPFRLDDRVPGQSIVLARYTGYHHGPPLLERVAFVGSADIDITIGALRDENLLLAELPWSVLDEVENSPNLRTGAYPENGFYFLGFNLREGRPFADVRVRRALALALDLPDLVEAATKGQGVPISSSAVPGSWADLHPAPSNEANLQAARDLLNEAGWTLPAGATIRQRNGESFSAQLFVRGDDERRLVAAQRIAEAAATIGLQIEVEAADFETVIVSKYAPPYNFDLLLGSWLNGAGDPNFGDFAYYDPDDFALFHSSQINQGPLDTRVTRNFIAFDDPAYDNQAQAARELYELDERRERYEQTQERLNELLPYLFLWVDQLPVAINQRVTSLDGPIDLSSPMYLWNIERWYVEDEGSQPAPDATSTATPAATPRLTAPSEITGTATTPISPTGPTNDTTTPLTVTEEAGSNGTE
jgi:peptide/nickel transport system substrate-binding protein